MNVKTSSLKIYFLFHSNKPKNFFHTFPDSIRKEPWIPLMSPCHKDGRVTKENDTKRLFLSFFFFFLITSQIGTLQRTLFHFIVLLEQLSECLDCIFLLYSSASYF